jgi:hypothetical protein
MIKDVNQLLEPNEKVVLEIHRHWINVAPILLGLGLAAIATLYGFYSLGRYGDKIFGLGGLAALGLVIIAILIAVIALASIWVYRQSCVIITPHKIIQVTQNGLFGRTISQFSLDHMQDVSASQKGFLPTVLGYGSVEVETAGEMENFVFNQAPNPKQVAAVIMKMHQDFAPEHAGL